MNSMIGQLERDLGKKILTGVFGADMQVDILNDGPVTILIDTKEKGIKLNAQRVTTSPGYVKEYKLNSKKNIK